MLLTLYSALILCVIGPQVSGQQASSKPVESSAVANTDAETTAELRTVKRIYVDSFGDDAAGKQFQAMMINALASTKRFVITENKDKAEAILRGNAVEKSSQELHATSEGTAVGSAAGAHSSSVNGTVTGDTGSISGSSSGGFAARTMGIHDSQASTETIRDAVLAVRLVLAGGDVVWSTTQESKGAKYKSASADVVDLVVKQLLRDLDKTQADARR